ncbi:MAG: helix-turn-helix domain-containing protein [Armatimonadetes bacterium]|nr:helix-turn-helix domain-containing protein [Armatimonadota bacterium]
MEQFDPSRQDFSPYGFSCVPWTPTRMPRSDRHNEIEANLLDGGTLTYLMAGRRVTVPAGRLTVFWGGIPHQILEFEGLTDYYVFTVPLAWFLQWRLPDHLTHAILHGAAITDPVAGNPAADRERFERWNEDLAAGSGGRQRAALLEIEARLLRLALSLAADAPKLASHRGPAIVEQQHLSRAEEMAGFIARSYTQPLTAEAIARHVGLHPNYAMALFQRTFGTTLTKYVCEHRLSHAQRLLVVSGDPIANIAFNSGFGSLSRFNEAFRKSFGCTPREYRRQHESA